MEDDLALIYLLSKRYWQERSPGDAMSVLFGVCPFQGFVCGSLGGQHAESIYYKMCMCKVRDTGDSTCFLFLGEPLNDRPGCFCVNRVT